MSNQTTFALTNRDAADLCISVSGFSRRLDFVAFGSDGEAMAFQNDTTPIRFQERTTDGAAGDNSRQRITIRLSVLPETALTLALILSPEKSHDDDASTNSTSSSSANSSNETWDLLWHRDLPAAEQRFVLPAALSTDSSSSFCVAAFHRAAPSPSTSSFWSLVVLNDTAVAIPRATDNQSARSRVSIIQSAVLQTSSSSSVSSSSAIHQPTPPASAASTQSRNNNDDDDDDDYRVNRHMPLSATNSQTEVSVGASWDEIKGKPLDLDLSAIACGLIRGSGGGSGVHIVDRVFWGKLTGLGGAIEHSGDNESGEGEGDDETITVLSLPSIPDEVVAIFFLLSKYSAEAVLMQQHNMRVRVVEKQPGLGADRGRPMERINRGEMHRRFVAGNGAQSECFAAMVRKPNRSCDRAEQCVGAPWHLVEMAVGLSVESALDPAWEVHVAALLNAALNPVAIPNFPASPPPSAPLAQPSFSSSSAQLPPPPEKHVAQSEMRSRAAATAAAVIAPPSASNNSNSGGGKSAAPMPVLSSTTTQSAAPPAQSSATVGVFSSADAQENLRMILYLIAAFLIIAFPFWMAM